MIVVIETNENNKIEITKKEFETYLQEAWREGYNTGKSVIYTPSTIETWKEPPKITCNDVGKIKWNNDNNGICTVNY